MYAVIESGGKQYRVELGNELEVERLEAAPGDTVEIDRVLLVADGETSQIGRPMVEGALVQASVVRQDRGDKIIVFKYRPKARHRVKRGHRQELTVIRIADIQFDGRSAAEEAADEARKEERARARAEKEAARKAAADQALAAKLAADAEQQARDEAEKEAAAAPTEGAEAEAGTGRRRRKPSTKAAEAKADTKARADTEANADTEADTGDAAEAAKDAEAKADTEADTGAKAEAEADTAEPDADTETTTAHETTPAKRRRTKKDD